MNGARPGTSGERVTAAEARDFVQRLFANAESAAGAFRVDDGGVPQEVIPGLLFRIPMYDEALGYEATMTLFINPGPIGRLLWQREARTLLRLTSVNHPAMPNLHDAGIRDIDDEPGARVRDIAYVISGRPAATLGNPGQINRMRENPRVALRQLSLLADALLAMHNDGLLHRNIHAGTINIDDTAEGALSFSGFEMSSFQANLLRRGVESEEKLAAQALTSFVNQGRHVLGAVAPERLTYLMVPGPVFTMPEQAVGDVYSLGVIAYLCFVGDLEEARLAAAFPEAPPSAGARMYGYDHVGWLDYHAEMLDAVRRSKIGRTLRRLLLRLLDQDPRVRPSAAELVKDLRRGSDSILEELFPTTDQTPYLVAVDPGECGMLRSWGWISEQPLDTDLGQREVIEFLNSDLRSAWLEYAPGELVEDIPRTATPEMARCSYVLRGRLGSYYGEPYRTVANARHGSETDYAFMIRWALPRKVESETFAARPGRRVHSLTVVSNRSRELKPERGVSRPQWTSLYADVQTTQTRSERQQELAGALHWLLAYQRVTGEARKYPFTVDKGSRHGRTVTLTFDVERDRAWRMREPLRNLFTSDAERRPRMGDFFGAAEDRGFDGTVRWWPDAAGAPKRTAWLTGTGFVQSAEPDRLQVTIEEGELPDRGWIEPSDDLGRASALERQREAVGDLLDRPGLMAALQTPKAIPIMGDDYRQAGEGFSVRRSPRAGESSADIHHEQLVGDRSLQCLDRMLTWEPMYVLQGPPGTGKTTITARAIRAMLLKDPAARILVVAQSHHALDNLALEVRRTMPDGEQEPIAVRMVTRNTETKVTNVSDWTPRAILQNRRRQIASTVRKYVQEQRATLPVDILAVLEAWLKNLRDHRAEIADRTLAGANLVFATCITSADAGPALLDRPPLFDWVIVEEAAKAFPTELAVPLVRGSRWTLIGDHKQLSPYELRQMVEVLDLCKAQMEDMGLSPLLRHADSFPRYFELFRSIFDGAGSASTTTGRPTTSLRRPVDALDLQFRMVRPIGELVRDAFYPDALSAYREASNELDSYVPDAFGDARLIWLNTDDEDEMVRRGLRCEGERHVIAQVLARMWHGRTPRPADLAILSPYRAQCTHLATNLPAPYRPLVHTVDSFQGRQARVIIVSLVRGYQRRESRRADDPSVMARLQVRDRIGHLGDPARTNVLLSRAREHLIVVGQYNHFHDTGRIAAAGNVMGAFWKTVCDGIAAQGRVLKTNEWLEPYRGDAL